MKNPQHGKRNICSKIVVFFYFSTANDVFYHPLTFAYVILKHPVSRVLTLLPFSISQVLKTMMKFQTSSEECIEMDPAAIKGLS